MVENTLTPIEQGVEDLAITAIEETRAHAASRLRSQLDALTLVSKEMEIHSSLAERLTDLWLIGVMCKFGERYLLPTTALDRAYLCLLAGKVGEQHDANFDKARNYCAELRSASLRSDGQTYHPWIQVGFNSAENDGSLAALYRQVSEASPQMRSGRWKILRIGSLLALAIAVISALVAHIAGAAISVVGAAAIISGFVSIVLVLAVFGLLGRRRKS